MVVQQKSQNRKPEKIVLVIGILFLIFGAIGMQLVQSDGWIFPAMFVIWGTGAIVNAVGGWVRAARVK